jgi:hypothetical protein
VISKRQGREGAKFAKPNEEIRSFRTWRLGALAAHPFLDPESNAIGSLEAGRWLLA